MAVHFPFYVAAHEPTKTCSGTLVLALWGSLCSPISSHFIYGMCIFQAPVFLCQYASVSPFYWIIAAHTNSCSDTLVDALFWWRH